MSRTVSTSTGLRYGVSRVCRLLGTSRSGIYASQARRASSPLASRAKRGPKVPLCDRDLTERIREVLAASPFVGEGHRKVWARLRANGIRTSKRRVLVLMRRASLLAPGRTGRPRGPQVHDGTIIPEQTNQRWGTDLTTTWTIEDGTVGVFVVVDHHNAEGLAVRVAQGAADRFEAIESLRTATNAALRSTTEGIAAGIELRHDHGSQFVADVYQAEAKHLGFVPSAAFVRQPEGNGCAERFIRTLKEQLLWLKTFRNRAELQAAIDAWLITYNHHWLLERHGYRSPVQIRAALARKVAA